MTNSRKPIAAVTSGRHFLQLPGPTNVPDVVLAALARPTIDHRGPECSVLIGRLLDRLRVVAGTAGEVVIYPGSGTGAWEAALVNTLSPGDRVVIAGAGNFVTQWAVMAEKLGYVVARVGDDVRYGADPQRLHEVLSSDSGHGIAAVCVVHNETSTGVTSRIADVRSAIDSAGHPALLLVDAVSSFGSVNYLHDDWRVDVTITGSQKGLMLPPGIGINVIGPRALEAAAIATTPRAYWDWMPHIEHNRLGSFPYTPPINMLVALDVALGLMAEEGMANIASRHERHAAATRAAVSAWGLDIVSADRREHSPTVTAVMVDGRDTSEIRDIARTVFNMSLGAGLGTLAGTVFRIGHLGHLGDLELVGALGGVEMALRMCGLAVPSGLPAALDSLEQTHDRNR